MKRIMKLVLLVLIPVLITVGIGTYSYVRYQNSYFSRYMSRSSYKNSEKEIDAYIKYDNSLYQEFYKEDVKNEGGKDLFTIKVVRTFKIDSKGNNVGFDYSYILYNVNYGNVYQTIAGEKGKFTFLPELSFTLVNNSDITKPEGNIKDYNEIPTKVEGKFDTKVNYSISDFEFVGYTNKEGKKTKLFQNDELINNGLDPLVKWQDVSSTKIDFDLNVRLVVAAKDMEFPTLDDSTKIIYKHDFTNYNTSKSLLNKDKNTYKGVKLEEGYSRDIHKAGYDAYVFSKYIWWEALLAIFLTEIVTGSAVIVWNSEEQKEKERQKKLAKKK